MDINNLLPKRPNVPHSSSRGHSSHQPDDPDTGPVVLQLTGDNLTTMSTVTATAMKSSCP